MIDYATAGTYASFGLTPRSVKRLKAWAKRNLSKDDGALFDYHITICYSKKPIAYQAMGLLPPMPVKPVKFSLFGKDKNYLVLEVTSSFANNRQEYSKLLGAVSDFPQYSPHISLAKGFDGKISDLEPFEDILYISREDTTPLDSKYGSADQNLPSEVIKQVLNQYRKLGISTNLTGEPSKKKDTATRG